MKNNKTLLEKFTKHLNETNNVEHMSEIAYLLTHLDSGLAIKEEYIEPLISLMKLETNPDESKITFTLFSLLSSLNYQKVHQDNNEMEEFSIALNLHLFEEVKELIKPCVEKSLWDQYEYVYNPERPDELQVSITDPFLYSLIIKADEKLNAA